MVAQILVAQGQTIYSLRHQLSHGVLDQVRIPRIFESLCESMQNSGSLFSLTQKKTASVRGDIATVKSAYDLSLT
jgi:hypothetical protein